MSMSDGHGHGHGPGSGGNRGLPDDDTDLGKYSLSNMITERLPDGVALSQHATHRYRERTPHDCQVALETAFCAGSDIAHPVVGAKLGGDADRDPDRCRVFCHSDGHGGIDWGVVFLLIDGPVRCRSGDNADEVIVTAVSLEMYSHPPTRAYLHCYGPHAETEEERQ